MFSRLTLSLIATTCAIPLLLANSPACADGAYQQLSCEEVFDSCDARDRWIGDCAGCDLQNGQDPGWQLRADFLMLKRELQGAPLVTSPGGGNLVSAGQLSSGYSPGFELEARRSFGGFIADVRYFQVDTMNASLSRDGLATDIVTGLPVFAAGTQQFAYGSDIRNVEVNLMTDNDSWLRGLVGFRYINYEESLSMLYPTGTPVPGSINSSTWNDLFGMQIGGEADFFRNLPRFSLTGIAKAGLFGASTRSLYNEPGTFTGRDSAGSAAFVGELGLNGRYLLTRWLSIEGGYRVLFIDGIALAGEQFSTTNVAVPVTRINQGDVFLHGFNVGLVANW